MRRRAGIDLGTVLLDLTSRAHGDTVDLTVGGHSCDDSRRAQVAFVRSDDPSGDSLAPLERLLSVVDLQIARSQLVTVFSDPTWDG
jgi:hypothetical protein